MKQNKLRARWSKAEKDILVTFPLGIQTECDANYLLSDIFTKDFVKEVTERGYDIKTLKFEIKVDETGKRFETKFPTLAKEEKEGK